MMVKTHMGNSPNIDIMDGEDDLMSLMSEILLLIRSDTVKGVNIKRQRNIL